LIEVLVAIANVHTPYWWLGSAFAFLFLAGVGALAVAAGGKELYGVLLIQLAVPLLVVAYPTPFSFDDSKGIADSWIQSSPHYLAQGLSRAIISYADIPFNLGSAQLARLIEPNLTGLPNWKYLLTTEGSVNWEAWTDKNGKIFVKIYSPFSDEVVYNVHKKYVVWSKVAVVSTLAELQQLRIRSFEPSLNLAVLLKDE